MADLVALLLLAAGKGERLRPDGTPGQGIYFIAAQEDPTYAELGQAMAKALGRNRATVVHLPGPFVRLVGFCGDALGRVRQRPGWVNSDKIAEALAGSWTCSSAKARRAAGLVSRNHVGRSPARNGPMVSPGRMALSSHQGGKTA